VIGSAITHVLSNREDGRQTASASVSSTKPSTDRGLLVTRIHQKTFFDGWILVVTQYSVVTALRGFRSFPDHKWLVIDARLTNSTQATREFTPDLIEVRTLGYGGEAAYVSAIPGEVEEPDPGKTVTARFVFSVPTSSRVFALVIRRALRAGKERGDAVEVDLNCC